MTLIEDPSEAAARTNESAISVEQLEKRYASAAGEAVALVGVTHSFARGSFTAVMGPSGSGKSTLLQCAAGLDQPTAGRVLLGDVELGGLNRAQLAQLRRTEMGFIFQAYNLLPALTVYDNVALPQRLAGRRPRRAEVKGALARVGLDDLVRRRPAELSGGQQQRVAIARALLSRPAVVFADEPTGALDSRSGRIVLDLLREAADLEGQTVLMVTHDPVAAATADEVVFLRDGAIVGRLGDATAAQIAGAMSGLET
ncbi:ABC transporter ATP-binding protein [Nocardioidaceae bacterium SCSIO 66511]|nr:ABC transporter ATP-binding protein [Nocardioidaceae bacterium SCSIO 66511]